MLLEAVARFQDGLDTLLRMGLEPYAALALIVAVYAWGASGLRRARQEVSRRWASLEAHHRVVLRASEGARVPGDAAIADGWADLEEHVRRVSWDDVPGRVLALIVRQAWSSMPDLAAIAVAARSGSWPDLERQRRTPRTLLLLGLGGAALAGIGAIVRVDHGAWDGGVPWAVVGPQAAAALAVAFVGVVAALLLHLQMGRVERRAAMFVDELLTVATGPWVDAVMQAASWRFATEPPAVPEVVDAGGEGDAGAGSGGGREASLIGGAAAAQAFLVAARSLERLVHDLEQRHTRLEEATQLAHAQTHARLDEVVDRMQEGLEQYAGTADATVLAINRVADHLTALAERLDAQSEQLETARQTLLAGFSDGFRQTGERVAAELVPAVQMLGALVRKSVGIEGDSEDVGEWAHATGAR